MKIAFRGEVEDGNMWFNCDSLKGAQCVLRIVLSSCSSCTRPGRQIYLTRGYSLEDSTILAREAHLHVVCAGNVNLGLRPTSLSRQLVCDPWRGLAVVRNVVKNSVYHVETWRGQPFLNWLAVLWLGTAEVDGAKTWRLGFLSSWGEWSLGPSDVLQLYLALTKSGCSYPKPVWPGEARYY